LGARLDRLNQVPLGSDDGGWGETDPLSSSMPPPPIPSKALPSTRRSATDDSLVLNEPPVSPGRFFILP
jgi:hypothetical protein